ncbi:MAG TPA: PEP-CTERM sorting domain-containing protein [Bryobacteraceae bacterium]|jgi:hypothetical protein
MKNSILVGLFAVAAIGAIPASASTGTFTFTSGNNTGNGYGDVLNFAPTITGGTFSGLTNVAVSSYSTKTISTSTAMYTGAADEYSGYGLGVCGQKEGTGCQDPQHQVDNSDGGYEFVLFKFSTPVDLSSVTLLDYSGTDMDMSYWSGNTAPPTNLTNVTDSQFLTNFGSQANDTCTSNCSSGDTITDNLSGNNVTYLLIAAAYNTGNNNDTFKIESLSVGSLTATPEPATFGLIGFALAGIGLIARKRRKN